MKAHHNPQNPCGKLEQITKSISNPHPEQQKSREFQKPSADKQTDTQTNKQTDRQTNICYFLAAYGKVFL